MPLSFRALSSFVFAIAPFLFLFPSGLLLTFLTKFLDHKLSGLLVA